MWFIKSCWKKIPIFLYFHVATFRLICSSRTHLAGGSCTSNFTHTHHTSFNCWVWYLHFFWQLLTKFFHRQELFNLLYFFCLMSTTQLTYRSILSSCSDVDICHQVHIIGSKPLSQVWSPSAQCMWQKNFCISLMVLVSELMSDLIFNFWRI